MNSSPITFCISTFVHNKTIEKQVAKNLRYNKDFSEELNKGFKI
jgi:hypothetical protein